MSIRNQPTGRSAHISVDEGKFLTTRQFAHLVGSTLIDVTDKHRSGVFRAAIDGGQGRGKRTLYSHDQIEAWQAMGSVEARALGREARRHFTGEEAKKCFIAFANGRDVAECVAEFGIHPLTVQSIHASWAQSKSTLFISAAILAKIQVLTLDGPLPIETEEDLLEVLTIASRGNEPKLCALCSKGERSVCRRCAAKTKTKTATPLPEPPPLENGDDEEDEEG